MIHFNHYPCFLARHIAWVLLSIMIGSCLVTNSVFAQGDALEESSVQSEQATQSLILDLEKAGNRLIAVGERGHILVSDDNADSWQQSAVPVRVTLTASFFIDHLHGWAVGHDGVILRTNDGGKSWIKLLDGYKANELMLHRAKELVSELEATLASAPPVKQEHYETALDNATILFEDAEAFTDEGPSRPFLDVWFKNKNEGFVVGAFGLILRTTDGGNSWSAWFDRLNNPEGLHLNSLQQIHDQLFIAAEAGTLYRSDDWGKHWEVLTVPYDGSFFGVVGTKQGRIITYGLRGNAYESRDWGENWKPINTEVDASLFGGTILDDGTIVLVGSAGTTLFIDSDGRLTNRLQSADRLPLSKVIKSNKHDLLAVGLGGIQSIQTSTTRP